MDVMLRKFFHVGLEENNASVAGNGGGAIATLDPVVGPILSPSSIADSVAGNCFDDLETQLDVFEGANR